MCERGWLIDSLLSACSCKWESVDIPESAYKRQSINCLYHLPLSFSASCSFVSGFHFLSSLHLIICVFSLSSFSCFTPPLFFASISPSGPFSYSFFLLLLPPLLFIYLQLPVAYGDSNQNLYILIILMCKMWISQCVLLTPHCCRYNNIYINSTWTQTDVDIYVCSTIQTPIMNIRKIHKF